MWGAPSQPMGSLRRRCAKIREPSELRFGMMCGDAACYQITLGNLVNELLTNASTLQRIGPVESSWAQFRCNVIRRVTSRTLLLQTGLNSRCSTESRSSILIGSFAFSCYFFLFYPCNRFSCLTASFSAPEKRFVSYRIRIVPYCRSAGGIPMRGYGDQWRLRLYLSVCFRALERKKKRLELSTSTKSWYTYTLWQDLGMHWPRGQKVKGQGHTVIKCAVGMGVRRFLVTTAKYFEIHHHHHHQLSSSGTEGWHAAVQALQRCRSWAKFLISSYVFSCVHSSRLLSQKLDRNVNCDGGRLIGKHR